MEKKVYNPFGLKEYYIIEKDNKKYFKYDDLLLELSETGYIPKSGLLYDFILNENCKDKSVLDLGCGYLGILGLIAHMNGAKKVDSIDFDIECVKWFEKLIKDNNLENMNCFYSNYYENISGKYDLILSNPPQMPMLEGSIHDSGGPDGRKYIYEILEKSFDYLNDNGYLYILMFDFLGIDSRTSDQESIFEYAKKIGYTDFEILLAVDKKLNGGVTYDSIPYINTIYPYYDFGTDNKKCQIKIARLKK